MTFALRLPDSLMKRVKSLADRDKVSVNQFVVAATAEKTSAMETEKFFRERAQKADPKAALEVLKKVARFNNPVLPGDELPADSAGRSPKKPARPKPRQCGQAGEARPQASSSRRASCLRWDLRQCSRQSPYLSTSLLNGYG
jgi:hypothetical protein